MLPNIDPSWLPALGPAFASETMAQLNDFLDAEAAAGRTIYPPRRDWFRALELTPLPAVRAVILGQDPYHGPGQAHGLSFSVPVGVQPPPSLVNIFKELESDLGLPRPAHGCLSSWARSGVLLLNSVLTVEAGRAAAHRERGWERFTDAVIRAVAAKPEPVVFLLWGGPAQSKAEIVREIDSNGQHLILTAPHPSPLSAYRGWFGCRHFSRANDFLEEREMPTIDWTLPAHPGEDCRAA